MTKKKNFVKDPLKEKVTLDGLMTIGVLENGLHAADFMCCDDAELDPLVAQFKVQIMRDGNVYMMELPKRVRNKSIFREDNSLYSVRTILRCRLEGTAGTTSFSRWRRNDSENCLRNLSARQAP